VKIEDLPFIDKPYIKKTVNWDNCPHCDKKIRTPNRIGWNWYHKEIPDDMRAVIIMECKYCFKKYCYHNGDITPLILSYQEKMMNHLVHFKMQMDFEDLAARMKPFREYTNKKYAKGFVYINGKFFNLEGCEKLIAVFERFMENHDIGPDGTEISDRENIK